MACSTLRGRDHLGLGLAIRGTRSHRRWRDDARDAAARPPAVRSAIVTTWLNAPFEMRFRLIGGLTVRFAASEDHGADALLLSPWPESLLAYEPMWWGLARHARLVAVDLPGFGDSPRSQAPPSPQAMGEFIITAA